MFRCSWALSALFCLFLGHLPAQAQAQIPAQPRIANPPAYALELLKDLEKAGAGVVADRIVLAVAQPNARSQLNAALSVYEKRPAKVAKIAADRDFGGAVRVITVYAYGLSESTPYVYFQIVFKMTDTGWVMTGFGFKAEIMNAFPPEMTQYIR